MNRIFVQIASYRDPQLGSTLYDCIEKASDPERLRFGICCQSAPADTDTIGRLRNDSRFRILDRPSDESRGVGWARSEAQKLFRDEEYYLQIDSHMRFVQDWDRRLIDVLERLPSERPVLTTYPAPYSIAAAGRETLADSRPQAIECDRFDADGIPQSRQVPIPRSELFRGPAAGYFIAAGFIFSHGAIVTDVPYDPDIYFEGEEISLSLRAFTHGYDIFHPHQNFLWHLYERKEDAKHWTDHAGESEVLHGRSASRIDTLLRGDTAELGRFGLGVARSREDYAVLAGIDLERRELVQAPPEAALVDVASKPAPPQQGKIAFLFLTRSDLNQAQLWKEFFAQSDGAHSVYAHAAQPGLVADPLIGGGLIERYFHTRWGHVSLVHATLAMLRAAFDDRANRHFVLVSESCVPIKPFSSIYASLVGDPRGIALFEDLEQILTRDSDRGSRFDSVDGIEPQHWYSHSQWIALCRDHVEALITTVRARAFRQSFAPDEAYFLTSLAASGFDIRAGFRNQSLTWTRHVNREPHPSTFDRVGAGLLAELRGTGALFARKFSPQSDIGKYRLHLEGGGGL